MRNREASFAPLIQASFVSITRPRSSLLTGRPGTCRPEPTIVIPGMSLLSLDPRRDGFGRRLHLRGRELCALDVKTGGFQPIHDIVDGLRIARFAFDFDHRELAVRSGFSHPDSKLALARLHDIVGAAKPARRGGANLDEMLADRR